VLAASIWFSYAKKEIVMARRSLFVLLLVFAFSFASQLQADDTVIPPPMPLEEMFNNVNALRASKNLAPLTLNSALTQAAQEQADYISNTGNYAHYHGGSSPTTRAMAASYQTTEWCCSENTHRTQIGKSAWEFWNYSLPHYHNMLNPKWTEIGLAISNVGPWTGYVLVFGSGIQNDPVSALISAPVNPPAQTTTSTTPPVTVSAGGYRVVWGDTLSNIARRYGVSVSDLRAANGLTSDLIYAGQVLVIPGVQGQTVASVQGSVPVPANVTAQITSPASGSVVRSGLPIMGTARFDSTQAMYYKVEISGGQFGANWVTIGDVHTGSASNTQLEFLNIVQPGSYSLRLVIVGNDSNSLASASVSFQVQ
jgi:LysM repeat protein